jgi:hypothetical protein
MILTAIALVAGLLIAEVIAPSRRLRGRFQTSEHSASREE